MLKSLYYLLLISEVEEVEIFKVCLEYWSSLAAELYHETPFSGQLGLNSGPYRLKLKVCHLSEVKISTIPFQFRVSLNGPGPTLATGSRRETYKPILTKVRYIMISRMAKPEEVLVVENDQVDLFLTRILY